MAAANVLGDAFEEFAGIARLSGSEPARLAYEHCAELVRASQLPEAKARGGVLDYIDKRIASLHASLPPTPDISGYTDLDLGRHAQIYDELRVIGHVRDLVAAKEPSDAF